MSEKREYNVDKKSGETVNEVEDKMFRKWRINRNSKNVCMLFKL